MAFYHNYDNNNSIVFYAVFGYVIITVSILNTIFTMIGSLVVEVLVKILSMDSSLPRIAGGIDL